MFIDNKDKINGIITGISYIDMGIRADILNENFINFANPSQDIYYDYHIAKRLIKESEKIKYCIIGLNYYSLHYDLSLSSINSKIISYYKFLNKVNNYKNIKALENNNHMYRYHIDKKIGEEILQKNQAGNFILYTNEIIRELTYEKGKMQAHLDSNKNYPATVKENIELLNEYLSMLIGNSIKPILVIAPTTKYYNKYFSDKLKYEFIEIIGNLAKEFNVQLLDHFSNERFKDEDFNDVSHINRIGAEKFTNILNKEILW